jgi:hypothetical protein
MASDVEEQVVAVVDREPRGLATPASRSVLKDRFPAVRITPIAGRPSRWTRIAPVRLTASETAPRPASSAAGTRIEPRLRRSVE